MMRLASHSTRLSENLTPTAIANENNEIDSGSNKMVFNLFKINHTLPPNL